MVRVNSSRRKGVAQLQPCRSSGLRKGERVHSQVYQTHTVLKQITRQTIVQLNMMFFTVVKLCKTITNYFVSLKLFIRMILHN